MASHLRTSINLRTTCEPPANPTRRIDYKWSRTKSFAINLNVIGEQPSPSRTHLAGLLVYSETPTSI